ncbi:MAG: helix-turn-helix transcriptional regulator [Citrobacter telavivensis]
MMNIAILDNNTFSRISFELLTRQIIEYVHQTPVNYQYTLAKHNTKNISLTVINFLRGELLLCNPELCLSGCNTVIALLDNDEAVPRQLPNCYENVYIIRRNDTLSKIVKVITAACNHAFESKHENVRINCWECRKKYLSQIQIQLMRSFIQGLSCQDISMSMHIKDKTVYQQKRIIMQNFNLRSNQELLNLLTRMNENPYQPYHSCPPFNFKP